MHWLFAIIGLVLGATVSNGSAAGSLGGALIGWLIGKQNEARALIGKLSERVRLLEGSGAAAAIAIAAARARASEPAAVQPEPVAQATATPEPTRASEPASAAASAPAPQPPRAVEPPPLPEPAVAFTPAAAAAAIRTPTPPRASGPDFASVVKRWFTEGNVPVKIGVLVLFFGVAAALKYAVDQGLFNLPMELRLAGIAGLATAALAFGWRERLRRRAFGLSIQGGALGVLMLTVFAAYARYELLPPGLAFALLLIVVAGAAALAVLQNALALAVLGVIGGFLAPVLINTGSNNYVGLFTYYAVLNAGIFAVAWVRPWRVLNLVGFAFTFIVGLLWGIDSYRPEYLSTTEPFLILFFLFYVAIAVLYALRQPLARRGLVDGSLVFGVPLVAFPLQAALLKGDSMALAYSALAVAALYGVLAAWLMRREGLRTLATSFAALSVGFATLAVPIALSAQWTACAWALEGAALVWLGLRQRRALAVYSGALLHVLGALAYITQAGAPQPELYGPVLNGVFLSGAILSLSALLIARALERDGEWPRLALFAFLAGWLWWLVTGLREIEHWVAPAQLQYALAWFAAGTILVAGIARRALAWPRLAWPMLATYPVAAVLSLVSWDHGPLHELGVLAWPGYLLAGAIGLALLREPRARGLSFAHVTWLATLALLVSFELHARMLEWQITHTAWSAVAYAAPLALLLWATWRHPDVAARPLQREFPDYETRWFVPASLVLVLWFVASLAHDGDAAPLPFVPLLNPLELMQLGVLGLLFGIWRERANDAHRNALAATVLAAGFIAVSAATLRAVHHLAHLPWDASLAGEMLAQTSLTVVWSVLGVTAWIAGSRRGSRAVWLAGAFLMGLVLAKLLLVDRTYMGNIPGIVSFIAVGLLLTMVGYFAPSPPRSVMAERAA